MKRVQRSEILKRADYEKIRPEFRSRVMQQKEERRIHLGENLTFLFENHDTVLYQIQEMMRSEQLDDEAAIAHEIETYNELVGERGELGCTLLIEIEDKDQREKLLTNWKDLPSHLYLETQAGVRIPALFDKRQVGDNRVSSVQYMKFRLGDAVPVKIGSSHSALKIEQTLKPAQSAVLAKDLLG